MQAGPGARPDRNSKGSFELRWPQDTELCSDQALSTCRTPQSRGISLNQIPPALSPATGGPSPLYNSSRGISAALSAILLSVQLFQLMSSLNDEAFFSRQLVSVEGVTLLKANLSQPAATWAKILRLKGEIEILLCGNVVQCSIP